MNGDSPLLIPQGKPSSWLPQRNPGQTILLSFPRLNIQRVKNLPSAFGRMQFVAHKHVHFCLLVRPSQQAHEKGIIIPTIQGMKLELIKSQTFARSPLSLELIVLRFKTRAIWLQSPDCIFSVLTWQDQGRCCSSGQGLH